MDTFSLLQGVTGLSEYLSKDRYYLEKLITNYPENSHLIASRVAHHNKLVDHLNLVVSVAGGFAGGPLLFERYTYEGVLDDPDVRVNVADWATPAEQATDVPPHVDAETGEVLVVEDEHDAVPEAPIQEATPEVELTDIPDANVTEWNDRQDHTDITDAEHADNQAHEDVASQDEPHAPQAELADEPDATFVDDYVADAESSRMAHDALATLEASTAQHGPRRTPHRGVDIFGDGEDEDASLSGQVDLGHEFVIPSVSESDVVPIQRDIEHLNRGESLDTYVPEQETLDTPAAADRDDAYEGQTQDMQDGYEEEYPDTPDGAYDEEPGYDEQSEGAYAHDDAEHGDDSDEYADDPEGESHEGYPDDQDEQGWR